MVGNPLPDFAGSHPEAECIWESQTLHEGRATALGNMTDWSWDHELSVPHTFSAIQRILRIGRSQQKNRRHVMATVFLWNGEGGIRTLGEV